MNRGLLFVLVMLVVVAPAAFADGISMQICYSAAPNVYGSPSWSGYVANAITALQNGCATQGVPGDSPTAYTSLTWILPSNLMVTSYPSWAGQVNPTGAFANELGERLHAGLIVNGNGTQFSVAELSFDMQASDPSGEMSFTGDFLGYGYTTARVGVVNGPGGPTYITSGPETQMVDALYYVGIGNAFWPCVDVHMNSTCSTTAEQQAGLDDTAAYIYANGGNPGEFTVGTTYQLKDSQGNVLASVTSDISTPEPAAALLLGSGLLALGGLARRRRIR